MYIIILLYQYVKRSKLRNRMVWSLMIYKTVHKCYRKHITNAYESGTLQLTTMFTRLYITNLITTYYYVMASTYSKFSLKLHIWASKLQKFLGIPQPPRKLHFGVCQSLQTVMHTPLYIDHWLVMSGHQFNLADQITPWSNNCQVMQNKIMITPGSG